MQLERWRRMTATELRWRAAASARAHAQRLMSGIRAPQWDRSRLTGVLAPQVLDDRARRLVAAERWQEVHDVLATRLRSRESRFVLDPASAAELREQVRASFPDAAEDARRRADRMLRGELDLLGYRGLRFERDGRGIDWHYDPVHGRAAPRLFYTRVPYLDPAVGDHKIIWELNRHQHWQRYGRAAWLTGETKYARAILDELGDWLDANPPLVGINWASMLEVGFRTISWTWALHALLGLPDIEPATPWIIDLLVGIDRQLTHVEQNLSYYFSPNTHLTGEALALYVAGTALPELAGAARWTATGRRVLLDEIDRQILADGGHAERSTHYQRYTLDFYLLALLTARRAGDAGAAARFAEAAGRLATFTRAIADDNGCLPLIGDDDGGMLWPITGRACGDVRDSLSTAAAVLERPAPSAWTAPEEVAWIAGPQALADARSTSPGRSDGPIASCVLEASGYVVARDGHGGHAVLDVGQHGYMNAGHAHADALSIALTLAGRPFLIDPGTCTYTVDPALRDRMRSSMSHNTVTIDGRSPSIPAGPFHWQTRTDARLSAWRQNGACDWAEGTHAGYAPLVHRRSLVRSASGWLIADEILGSGYHEAAAHWHIDPEWALHAEPGRIRASRAGGDPAWLLHDGPRAELFRAEGDADLGWYAPVYGMLLPSPTARITLGGEGPLSSVTWIGHGPQWRQPLLSRIPAECDTVTAAIAVQIADADRVATYLLRPGGDPAPLARHCRLEDGRTDARVLHYAAAGPRLVSIDLIDARQFIADRRGWVSIDADEPFGDLHVEFVDQVIHLRASAPPPPLRLRGVTAAQRVQLNGRELPQANAMQLHTLLIHPADWHAPDTRPARPWPQSGAALADHSHATGG